MKETVGGRNEVMRKRERNDQGRQRTKPIRPQLVRCNEEVTSQFMNQRTREATNGNICWFIVDMSLLFYSYFMGIYVV